jgi:hypothetical protein
MLAPSPNFDCSGTGKQPKGDQTQVIHNAAKGDGAGVHLVKVIVDAEVIENLTALREQTCGQTDHEVEEE